MGTEQMKITLAILLLSALAALEFFHHVSDGHALDAIVCADPPAKMKSTSELLQQHLHGHH